jgi:hypothetical protein
MNDDGFGPRLRQERERRQIPLSSISANTKISVALFEALERDDVSKWPSGIFRRSFLRSYAEAIGLDPDATIREFLARFPDPGHPNVLLLKGGAQPDARPHGDARHLQGGLRLTLADDRSPMSAVPLSRRCAAVACDLGIVAVIALMVFMTIDRFWIPLSLAALGYYVASVLTLGNTPGLCLFGRQYAGRPLLAARRNVTLRLTGSAETLAERVLAGRFLTNLRLLWRRSASALVTHR